MTPLEILLAKLPGVTKSGNGWSARCPAHDDQHASLSVCQSEDGTALVKCHAGCDASAIVAAVDLTLADLFPAKDGPVPRGGETKPSGKAFPTAEDALASLERRYGKRSSLWTYHNPAGEPVGLGIGQIERRSAPWPGTATAGASARCPAHDPSTACRTWRQPKE